MLDTELINFIGLSPEIKLHKLPYLSNKNFNCIISHKPCTAVGSFNPVEFSDINLILSGHTHGGQIRIPGFGAIHTSSDHWKLFEYGHYQHKISNTHMIVTNGIGYTGPNIRLFCKPEIVRIRFK